MPDLIFNLERLGLVRSAICVSSLLVMEMVLEPIAALAETDVDATVELQPFEVTLRLSFTPVGYAVADETYSLDLMHRSAIVGEVRANDNEVKTEAEAALRRPSAAYRQPDFRIRDALFSITGVAYSGENVPDELYDAIWEVETAEARARIVVQNPRGSLFNIAEPSRSFSNAELAALVYLGPI